MVKSASDGIAAETGWVRIYCDEVPIEVEFRTLPGVGINRIAVADGYRRETDGVSGHESYWRMP